MKPSEKIEQIFQKVRNDKPMEISSIEHLWYNLVSVVEYLDSEWEKNQDKKQCNCGPKL